MIHSGGGWRFILLERRTPQPDALGARLHRRAHAEAALPPRELVENVGLARAVHTCDRAYRDRAAQLGERSARLVGHA